MASEERIPAGSLPPEKETVEEPTVEEPKVYAGKYKSPEELEEAYSNLSKKIGEQSGELGELRGKEKAYREQLEQFASQKSATPPKDEPPPTDYEGMLKQMSQSYENGDITFEEAIRQSNSMTAQQVQGMTQKEIAAMRDEFNQTLQSTLAERDMEVQVNEFHKEHPDYKDFLKSGELEAYKKKNPMHDDFSAYYELKLDRAKQDALDEAQRIREGSKPTETVLSKPGHSVQKTNKERTNDPMKLKEAMLRAVDSAES